jgi:hypothetical protein
MQENDDNLNFSFSFEHVFLTIGVGDKSFAIMITLQ